MDVAQTEKLKALALAADKAAEAIGEWPNVYWIADGIVLDQFAEFMAGCNPATVLELIADNERLRARFEYIEGNATTHGGGNGFTVSFFVPEDSEDIGCGIDAAIEKEKA